MSKSKTRVSQNESGGLGFNHPPGGTGGFTFIEAIVTMSLMMLVVVAGISSVVLLQKTSRQQSQYGTALQVAQGQLDEFLAIEYKPPVAPFGPSSYYESNYVLLTESKGGTAPPASSGSGDTGSGDSGTGNPGGMTDKELEDAIKDVEKDLKDAEKDLTDAEKDADKAIEDAEKAAEDAAKKPDDTKKAEKAAEAAAEAAAAIAAVAAAQQAVDSVTATLYALENPGQTPTPNNDGATMAAVITRVEPVQNGHLVTVEVNFMNNNVPNTVRLQTLVNDLSGGQP